MTPKITGIKAIDKKLAKLAKTEATKLIRKGLREGIKPVQAAAKQNAPVESGDLQKAIKVKAGKRKKDVISIQLQVGEKGSEVAEYAPIQEYGDPNRNIPAQGFLRRAKDTKEEEAKRIAKDVILKGIKDAMK